MFHVLSLLQLAPLNTARQREAIEGTLRSAAKESPEVRASLLQPTLPGVYNGGDLIWRLSFDSVTDYRSLQRSVRWQKRLTDVLQDEQQVHHVDAVEYDGGMSGGQSVGEGVYRVLLLSAKAPPAKILCFEAEMKAMPEYIDAIRVWQFSRVQASSGTRAWTHVWEQEYSDLQGLQGPYMMHPYHWAHIDRWFDPESPDWIVDTHLCHTFCAVSDSVIL